MLSIFLVGASSVKAKTLDVDLSGEMSYDGNVTWTWDGDAKKGHFEWKGTWSNAMYMPGLSGNLSAYTTVNWEAEAGTGSNPVTNHFRILIYFSNGAAQITYNPYDGGNPVDMTGEKSVTFAEMGVVPANLAYVSSIKISGAAHGTGDVYIKSFSLTGPDIVPIEASKVYEAPAGTTDLNGMIGDDSNKWSIAYPKEVGPQGEFAVGNLDADNKSVDISSYDYLHLVVTSVDAGKQLSMRVFTSEEKLNDNTKRHCIYARPIAAAANPETNWEEIYYISEPGIYVAKISGYPLLRGVKGGNGFNGDESNGKITVSQSYLCSGAPVSYKETGKYIILGKDNTGAASLTAALADANATFYDATGVIGTGINLTDGLANQNALFKANAGVLDHQDCPTIVDGVCEDFFLMDGDYPFNTPEAFTATNVCFYREFEVGKKSTVCLPFALTAEEATAAGTFYELSGVNGAGTELTFTDVTSSGTTAYKPYIFVASKEFPFYDGDVTYKYSSKSIPVTPATCTGETVEGYTLTGVLKGSSDVAGDNEGKTVYGWSGNDGEEGTFVKVGTGVAINPLRAYVVYDGGGASPARIAARFVGDSVTGINEVSETQNVLNPDRKYIENNNIVIVKNGVKYNAAGQLLK